LAFWPCKVLEQPHGFFHKSPWREKTLYRADEFLISMGYLDGRPTIQIPDAKDGQPKAQPKADPKSP
jgi:hypothetical protein